MSRPKIPTINWRSELNVLDEYIRSKGGVIHIITTEESPSSAFCKSLRNIMENGAWEKRWITVQLDGDNSSTHYLSDMIDQIEISLDLQPISASESGNNIHIGTNINAGGDVEIKDVNVNLPPINDTRERVERIVDTLKQLANESRLAILLFNTDSINTNRSDLKKFKRWIWDNNLSQLVSEGILLLAFSHRNSDTSDWLPDPDEIFDLASEYSEQSASHAKEDIATFLISQDLVTTKAEALAMAAGIFYGHPTPKELHAKFAGILARISAC